MPLYKKKQKNEMDPSLSRCLIHTVSYIALLLISVAGSVNL